MVPVGTESIHEQHCKWLSSHLCQWKGSVVSTQIEAGIIKPDHCARPNVMHKFHKETQSQVTTESFS